MRSRLVTAAAAAVLLAAGTRTANAQTSHMHLGGHVLYNTTFEDAGVGVQFSLPVARHLELYPSVDFLFESGASVWQPNLDLKYRILGDHNDWFYVGTGIGILQQSFNGTRDDHAGWNLFAGAESLKGNIHPFAEARVNISNYNRFQLEGGINITLGRH